MNGTLLSFSVQFVSAIAFMCGLSRLSIMDKPSRIVVLLLGISSATECTAYICARMFHNNMPVYNIYSLIEIMLLSLYFNYTIDIFSKYKIGIYIGLLSVALGVINLSFIQPITTLNSYFLLYEGFCVIGMALFAFFRLLLRYEKLRLHRYVHFWFTTIFLLYWCTTYLNWGVYDILNLRFTEYIWIINIFLGFVSIANYVAIAAVLLLYPKLRMRNE